MSRQPQREATSLLGRWYAEPLSQEEAARLIEWAEERLRKRLRAGRRCRLCPLLLLVGRFWLGREVDGDYRQLAARATTGRQRALVELVHGQLLMACRRSGAHEHLKAAFNLAVPLFAPGDYFAVLERHKALRRLPLSSRGAPPLPLEELLAAGRVIEQLERARAAGAPTLTEGTQ